MIAMRKYDINHESKATFNTYAYLWVASEIKKFVKDNESMIRVPQLKQNDLKYRYKFKDVDYFMNSKFMANDESG